MFLRSLIKRIEIMYNISRLRALFQRKGLLFKFEATFHGRDHIKVNLQLLLLLLIMLVNSHPRKETEQFPPQLS